MGITIHFNAQIEKKNKSIIPKILKFVEELAIKFNYEYQIFKGVLEKQSYEHREKNDSFYFREDENLDFKENNSKKKTEQNGVIIHNKEKDIYFSESFEVSFYLNPFTNKYEWWGFCKTQIFNKEETIPNLKFHIFIIKVLEQIKLRFLPNLYISDEGDFFFTEQNRQENINYYKEQIEKGERKEVYLKYIDEWENKKPYDIKTLVEAHGSNLSLINSIGGKLEGLGYDKSNIQTPVKNGDGFLKEFLIKLESEL